MSDKHNKSSQEKCMDEELHSEGNENGVGSSSESEGELQHKKHRTRTPSPHPVPPSFMVTASPPKFISFEDLMTAANGLKNMTLAHEIAVDNNFKLEKLEIPANSVQRQVKEIMHKAFWDALETKLREDPPDYTHALVLIQEVKENLFSLLLPQHARLRAQIDEVLDMELIQQKMDNDAFDIFYYSDYVVTIMAKLCAPARDERISHVREIKEVVPLFKEIFEVLDLMKMDMANFTIQQMRPYIQQQSVDYERKKFQEFLEKQREAGVDGLEFTKEWLKRSFDRLQQEAGQTPLEGATQNTPVTPAAVMNGAYMELLNWDENNVYPETLLIDQTRFMDLGEKTRRLTLISSTLLVTYNTVGSPISGVQSLKERLKTQICTILEGVPDRDLSCALENVGEQIHKEVNMYLKEHGFTQRDEGQKGNLLGQVRGLTTPDNPVLSVMSKRVLTFIALALFSRHTEPLKVPPGLSVVEKELSQICGSFLRLISHNRAVFGSNYAEIIGALIMRKPNLSS
ncbi:hypothetical protein CHS0354_002727 [Potamilus streckersoni]|uniref:T-complex protein 11-like protein 1 n=1 Tax=Potamilus streckersoni TaxID=2493646 RepID=A0AAE0SK49_9BIVA|nr:hypothetical protein CHS0354_002727 [Potamilus streckersoni]